MHYAGKADLSEITPAPEGLPDAPSQRTAVGKWEFLGREASQWDIQLIKN